MPPLVLILILLLLFGGGGGYYAYGPTTESGSEESFSSRSWCWRSLGACSVIATGQLSDDAAGRRHHWATAGLRVGRL